LRPAALLGAALAAASALGGCSPIYAIQSAAGHADLLMRRRKISDSLQDPRTPPALRASLLTADSSRKFAFDKLGLARTSDFSSWSPIDRDAVTYLVSGSRRTKLEPYEWSFPLVGRFPYKGYFKESRALHEKERLEKKGWDATVGGAVAYKTPLPFADPLPSPALQLSTGSLAALLVHELAHGTVYFKNQTEFDESAAEFIGVEGAKRYLAERFGKDSPELAAYKKDLEREAKANEVFTRLRKKLEALYAGPAADDEKLKRREPIFAAAVAELREMGIEAKGLNNANVVAHGTYHADLPFRALLDRFGGDFPRFVAELRSLDKKDPESDLRRRVQVRSDGP
jgi:predicted aminopeptidase